MIPQNDFNEKALVQECEQYLYNKMVENNGRYSEPCVRTKYTLDTLTKAARELVKKGYYAKVSYFYDRRASFQFLYVSKTPMDLEDSRMTYQRML